MGQPAPIPIPTTGPLDTTNPKSAVPPGTLVQAVDCGHRQIGPRRGRSLWNSTQGTAGSITNLGRSVYELDGVDDYWLHNYLAQQMVLGLQWTLDIVVEPTVVGSTSGTIFSMGDTTHTDIQVLLLGTGSGADERKVRVTVQASTSSAASGSAVTVTDSTQRTLANAGTPLQDFTKVYHIRVVRNGAALSLKVNGTETTGTGLSSTVGHNYVGDGFYVGTHSTTANNFLGGWVWKVLLRQGRFTDLRDGWFECMHPRHPNVLFACSGHRPWLWAGSSTGIVSELSRFRNYGVTTGSPAVDSVEDPFPLAFPTQAMAYYTDKYGVVHNLILCGGTMFHQRAT